MKIFEKLKYTKEDIENDAINFFRTQLYVPSYIDSLKDFLEDDLLDFGEDYCKLSIPRIIKHSQRREFLRADLKLKVILSFRDREYEEQVYEVQTINVCGRGICFNFREDITYAKDIRVEIFLSDRIVKTNASIVYVKPIETPDGLMFTTAMTLTTISDMDVNAIVRECFLYKLKENVDEHRRY